jgi:hypothetical protein
VFRGAAFQTKDRYSSIRHISPTALLTRADMANHLQLLGSA